MKFGDFVKVKSLATPAGFRENLQRLNLPMPCDDVLEAAPSSPMAQPLQIDGLTIGNRYTIHPMEGWDAEADGRPSDNTRRRWRNFGLSGAKLIWGGE
ncbi:MAG: NADH:flavin oxidoreductase, partial [Betaproteobacteria bacterium]|nr:NADH:flavin oxidoreductase [Betaproteobacteria bacterium]